MKQTGNLKAAMSAMDHASFNFTLNEVPFTEPGALSHMGIQVSSTEDVLSTSQQWLDAASSPATRCKPILAYKCSALSTFCVADWSVSAAFCRSNTEHRSEELIPMKPENTLFDSFPGRFSREKYLRLKK